MGWGKKLATAMLSVLFLFAFVQAVGGYLIGQLSSFQNTGPVLEPQVEEKVVRQMVLQLEPMTYYTFQLGAYEEAVEGQSRINELAQMGYRVCVSQGPPFQLWLGCLGKEPSVADLPETVRDGNRDIFVKKLILNEAAFRFSAEDGLLMEQVSTLLSSYDVVLKHSLKMFQDYRYDTCSEENWSEMIQQLMEELELIQQKGTALLSDAASDPMASSILDLMTVTAEYEESLQKKKEKKSDKVVLLAQSCLLELIEQYHSFIRDESDQKIDS